MLHLIPHYGLLGMWSRGRFSFVCKLPETLLYHTALFPIRLILFEF